MDRTRLRVVEPCEVFTPAEQVDFCRHCSKNVHDLSRMTRRQAERLLRRHEGRPLCVAFRARADGSLVFRSVAPLAAVCALLVACIGHLDAMEVSMPGDVCYDARGVVVDCADPAAGYQQRPDEIPLQPGAGELADPVASDPSAATAGFSRSAVPVDLGDPIVVTAEPADGSRGQHVQVNFEVDMEGSHCVGITVPIETSIDYEGPYGRLKFRPTDELWRELRARLRRRREHPRR